MSDRTPITQEQIELNKPVPWPIYDEQDRLLVKQGQTLLSKKQVKILLRRNAYFTDVEQLQERDEEKSAAANFELQSGLARPFVDPFHHIDELVSELSRTYAAIQKSNPKSPELLRNCYGYVSELVLRDADAALGAIHLYRKHKSIFSKPIFGALLAEILCNRLKYSDDAKETVVCAALVCNIASLPYQTKLDMQTSPLTDEQFKKIRKHPEEGVVLLHNAGFTNKHLLQIVLQHHERSNGTGYPRKLSGDQIHLDAKLASLVEYYSAVTAKRAYRSTKQAKEALREVYQNAQESELHLHLAFIKELGVFPPGTFLKLANGEIALVIKRQPFSVAPKVKAVMSPMGMMYDQAHTRDCTLQTYKIVESFNMDRELRHDLATLWDY